MGKMINLTNQIFTYWTVLERDTSIKSKNGVYWICQCKCGNKKSVSSVALRNGSSTSCGCRKIELASQERGKRINLLNQKFGKLTVIKDNGKDNHNRSLWLCQCECQNIISVRGDSLKSGNTQSCGCCSNCISIGEQKIKQLLLENNINFEQQKTFENCIYPDTKRYIKFDFYVDNRYIIEFDGRQHFQYDKTPNTWNTQKNYIKTKERDLIRNDWCIKNNIPIIRIPYTKINSLTFLDIWLPNNSEDKNAEDCTFEAVFGQKQ